MNSLHNNIRMRQRYGRRRRNNQQRRGLKDVLKQGFNLTKRAAKVRSEEVS